MLEKALGRPQADTPSAADELARVETALTDANTQLAELEEEAHFLTAQLGDVEKRLALGTADAWEATERDGIEARQAEAAQQKTRLLARLPTLEAEQRRLARDALAERFKTRQAHVQRLMRDYEAGETEIYTAASALCAKLEALGTRYLEIEAERATCRQEAKALDLAGIGFVFDPPPITQRLCNAIMHAWRRVVDR
jgi:chromosome segregation ATPase